MTRRLSIVGSLADGRLFRHTAARRIVFIMLVAVLAILTMFPQKYRAAVSLTPSDPASLGLSGTLGQLGAVNSVFGNQAAIEISLKVARSRTVRELVGRRLDLGRKLGKSSIEVSRWLDREVDIRALRGGIVQFEMTMVDAQMARIIVAAYADAVREQLAIIGRKQTAYKRQILIELVQTSSVKLSQAQAAYDTFRLKTRYSQPQSAIAAIGDRIPMIEETLRGKQVQLNAARQFATDENYSVKQILAEIDALKRQLDEARSVSPIEPSSVGRVVRESTEADKLRRDLDLAQGLYDGYKRYLQGTSVEDLTSTANVRILEPAYIDTARQYNVIPLALAVMIAMLGLAIELYALRPPVGSRLEGGQPTFEAGT